MRDIEVVIDTEEIAEYFLKKLTERGIAPGPGIVDELADITFDYLLEKCMIDEIEEDEDE